jgi:hypothetical protein
MSKEMKLCFGFLFLCSIVISGAVGYNYRNSEEINHTELVEKYISQERACTEATHRVSEFAIKNWGMNRTAKKKTDKEIAIERMQRN